MRSPLLHRRTALAGLLALALTGCASVTPPSAIGPATERHSTALPATAALGLATGTPSRHWWHALQDEQLNTLIDTALQGNPSLAVSRARLEQAVALSQVREAANGPQATLGVDATRQRYTANGLVPAPIAGNTYNSGTVQATLSWSPDFFGQHAKRAESTLTCFLPEVATDMNWSVEQFLDYCCTHKAGLPWDAWKKKGVEVYLFSAEVFGAPWDQIRVES